MSEEPLTITVTKAAAMTGLSPQTIRDAIKAKKMIAYRPARDYLIRYDTFMAWLHESIYEPDA